MQQLIEPSGKPFVASGIAPQIMVFTGKSITFRTIPLACGFLCWLAYNDTDKHPCHTPSTSANGGATALGAGRFFCLC